MSKNNPEHDAVANSNISFRTTEQNRNPVIQALERHNAFSKEQDLEYYLEHVLNIALATPDYVKGYGTGTGRRVLGNKSDPYLPRTCRLAIDNREHSDWNVVFWNGTSFDSTGTRPLIQGTEERDLIIGTDFSDLIFGLGEDDFICALGGDDTVFGDGEDWASPVENDGADQIFGGPGDDTLYGGAASDDLIGGSGHDALLAGHGFDWLEGDGGEHLPETAVPVEYHGDDFLVGMTGNFVYIGQGGNDVVNDYTYNLVPGAPFFLMGGVYDIGFTDTCYVFQQSIPDAQAGDCEIIIGK